MKLLQDLKDSGYRVQVQHLRLTPLELSSYLRRGRKSGQEPYLNVILRSREEVEKLGQEPSSRGGATRVCVWSVEEDETSQLLLTTYAYCNPTEAFSRKLGLAIACGRALRSLRGIGLGV